MGVIAKVVVTKFSEITKSVSRFPITLQGREQETLVGLIVQWVLMMQTSSKLFSEPTNQPGARGGWPVRFQGLPTSTSTMRIDGPNQKRHQVPCELDQKM